MRIYQYSVYNNQTIMSEMLKKTGFITFDRNLKFMGCSEYATTLFPELTTWELEKKIPGNGGRFNTFLRQPLTGFTGSKDPSASLTGTYEYKDEIYSYEIDDLYSSSKKIIGYTIRVSCITEAVKDSTV